METFSMKTVTSYEIFLTNTKVKENLKLAVILFYSNLKTNYFVPQG